MENMFCYQCEQTANCSGCTGNRGVCGKTADVANLQDALTGALIGLARATDGNEKVTKDTWHLMAKRHFCNAHERQFQRRRHRALHGRGSRGNRPPRPGLQLLSKSLRPQCRLRHAEALDGAGGHPKPQIPHSLRHPRHGRLRAPRVRARL